MKDIGTPANQNLNWQRIATTRKIQMQTIQKQMQPSRLHVIDTQLIHVKQNLNHSENMKSTKDMHVIQIIHNSYKCHQLNIDSMVKDPGGLR